MTNKEEQEVVRSVFRAYINDLKAHSTKTDRPTFKMLEEVKDKVIKALAQKDIIKKIRAEIAKEVINYSGTGEEVIQAYADGLKKGLDIIDKYKAESEDMKWQMKLYI